MGTCLACLQPCYACADAKLTTDCVRDPSLKPGCGAQKKVDAPEAKESLLSLLLNNVLKNPYIWAMALTYFFIYVVRQGVTSWFVFYLIKVSCLLPACTHDLQLAAQHPGVYGPLI